MGPTQRPNTLFHSFHSQTHIPSLSLSCYYVTQELESTIFSLFVSFVSHWRKHIHIRVFNTTNVVEEAGDDFDVNIDMLVSCVWWWTTTLNNDPTPWTVMPPLIFLLLSFGSFLHWIPRPITFRIFLGISEVCLFLSHFAAIT